MPNLLDEYINLFEENEIPGIGDTIRTKKMQMDGVVEKIRKNPVGYTEVLFRTPDGRLMKTPASNIIQIQKLEDGSMGGINRSHPAQDVSYEKVLDEYEEYLREEDGEYTFQTAKGSIYVVHANHTTTRTKAKRPEHGEDHGLMPTSDLTFYVTYNNVLRLSEIQTRSPYERRILVAGNQAAVQYLTGPNTGKCERRTLADIQFEPAVDLYPVELWNDGEVLHFGNKIVNIDKDINEGFLSNLFGITEKDITPGSIFYLRKLSKKYYITEITDRWVFYKDGLHDTTTGRGKSMAAMLRILNSSDAEKLN
jgi:hypothetical protein